MKETLLGIGGGVSIGNADDDDVKPAVVSLPLAHPWADGTSRAAREDAVIAPL